MGLNAIAKSVRKNWPELKMLMSGGMPQFVYGKKKFTDIPVFCFHEARLPELQQQLEFLKSNGYRTLNSSEYSQRISDRSYRNDGRDIVLTFDDGLASVWRIGFPLFETYDCKIILFVVAGLVPEADSCREFYRDAGENGFSDGMPLCSWQELSAMHASGIVDIQSHGMTHSLISTGSKIDGYISPHFDAYNFGNIHVPLYANQGGEDDRQPVLGHPIYEHDSRLSQHRRFIDSSELRQACAEFVTANGGENFFDQPHWQSSLNTLVRSQEGNSSTTKFETQDDRERAIRSELYESKRLIESRIPGTEVKQFCFPWFQASSDALRIAAEVGYSAVHVGLTRDRSISAFDGISVVKRMQQEYLLCLPGKGRSRIISIPLAKLRSRKDSRERRS